jgi:superfamily II helicase
MSAQIDLSSVMRECKKCFSTKPLTQFEKNKKCNFGYGYRCKTCSNEYNRTIKKQSMIRKEYEELSIEYKEEKPELDMYLDYIDNDGNPQSIKFSELEDYHFKAMFYNNLTVQLLMLIADKFNIHLRITNNTKEDIIKYLIDHGILSENALTHLVPAGGKFYKSDSETQCKDCLLIKPNDEFSRSKCRDCLKVYWRDRSYLAKIPYYEE